MKYSETFELALSTAARLHRGQVKSITQKPYIAHPLAVAALVINNGGDEDEASAALLHDAVEDAGGLATADLIKQQFGMRIYEIVMGCTDLPGPEGGPWRQRKQRYIEHLSDVSASVILVSVADKLDNVLNIITEYQRVGDIFWSRLKNSGRDDRLWYYRKLVEAYRNHGKGAAGLIDHLDSAVTKMEKLC